MNHGLVILLPTEIGGYVLQPDSSVTDHPADGSILGGIPSRSPVVQGVGRDRGMAITYLYVTYLRFSSDPSQDQG